MATDLREQLQTALSGAYVFERELTGGGMSRVFVATDVTFGRKVVVKVLREDLAVGVSAERFEREIRFAARLQHPHIVPVFSAGTLQGLPYFTMPYVEGESLRLRLAHGELPINEAISILRDVARALAYAHTHGVVHRDIKPDNVLLSANAATVTDFGVAKALAAATNPSAPLTHTGVVLGTPAYMAPEQAAGDAHIDHRVDIYAFGALAYELLTGHAPFAGRSAQSVLSAHVTEIPAPVDKERAAIPPAVAALVMRCLAKRPADRPQRADDLLTAIDAIAPPAGSLAADRPFVVHDRASRFRRRSVVVIAGLVVVGAIAVFAVARRHRPRAGPVRSIAVLPFSTIGGAPDESLREGLAVEITGALGKLPGLSVKGASLVRSVFNPALGPQANGRELDVESVLQGSVQRRGTRLRIVTELVNVADGFQQWTGTYDADFKDIFAVQDTIARAVAGELRLTLAGAQQRQVVRPATTNPEAHTLYLQGLYLWNKRTYQNIDQARSLFEQAIAKDPSYAQAHAGIAMTYAVLPVYADVSAEDALSHAVTTARHALAIDSSSVEAHAALGLASRGLYRNAVAERELRRAIALDSTFPSAHAWLAELLARFGRFGDAEHEARLAHDLDPQSRVIQSVTGTVLYEARRYADAESAARQLMRFDSSYANTHRTLTLVLLAEHRGREALAAANEALARAGQRQAGLVALLALAAVANGDTVNARALLRELLARSHDEPVSAAGIALLYDALGQRPLGVLWLERAVNQYAALFIWSRGPLFDGLRSDPRGAALLAKVESPNAALAPIPAK